MVLRAWEHLVDSTPGKAHGFKAQRFTTILRQSLKKIWYSVVDFPSAFRARFKNERNWFVATDSPGSPFTGRFHLLLAPSSGGNIGDQAMVEAFVENVSGQVVILASQESDIDIPSDLRRRVKVLAVPTLTQGGYTRSRDELRLFKSVLVQSVSFSVVGADVLDGAYSHRRSVQRITLATYAAELGIQSRILGFSWNANPDQRCLTALREAAEAGVTLYTRDPVSQSRLLEADIRAEAAADLAFAALASDLEVVQRELSHNISDFVVVNVNAILADQPGHLQENAIIVEHLRSKGLHVVFLPHDSRPSVDDRRACAEVINLVGANGVTLIKRMLTPSEVRGLLSRANLVVTGRMHVAIMALYSGVPPITLSRQGKVDGLMSLFESPELSIQPTLGFSSDVTRQVDALRSSSSLTRQSILQNVETTRALARNNFTGLVKSDS